MADYDSNRVGRRIALQVIGVGGLSATGLVGLAGCGNSEEGGGGGGESAGGGGGGCDTPYDQQSRTLRTTLQYREQSQEEGKSCSNCAQFVEGQHGDCGGCRLFTGPVQPNGHCQSWAPLAAAEPAAAEPAGEEPAAEEPAAEEAPAEATEEG